MTPKEKAEVKCRYKRFFFIIIPLNRTKHTPERGMLLAAGNH
jgi:hypothetical protein